MPDLARSIRMTIRLKIARPTDYEFGA